MIDFASPRYSVEFFSIEDGSFYGYEENVVHILACLWRDYENIHLTEYTFLAIPVSEFVEGYKEVGYGFVSDQMCEVKQYEADDLTPESASETFDDYFGVNGHKVLDYSEITLDTPIGNYVTEE